MTGERLYHNLAVKVSEIENELRRLGPNFVLPLSNTSDMESIEARLRNLQIELSEMNQLLVALSRAIWHSPINPLFNPNG